MVLLPPTALLLLGVVSEEIPLEELPLLGKELPVEELLLLGLVAPPELPADELSDITAKSMRPDPGLIIRSLMVPISLLELPII